MRQVSKRTHNKRGFTLGELLIVVAIIGVLVGISVPIFTGQLSKARLAANQENARQAKTAVLTMWMTEKYELGTYKDETQDEVYYRYNPSTGVAEYVDDVDDYNPEAVGVTYGGADGTDWVAVATNIAEWTTDTTVGNSGDTLGSQVYSGYWYLTVSTGSNKTPDGTITVYYVDPNSSTSDSESTE